jgi:hypothetical protein
MIRIASSDSLRVSRDLPERSWNRRCFMGELDIAIANCFWSGVMEERARPEERADFHAGEQRLF